MTGVPTRKRAKRKLNTREVEPRGATYSEREMRSDGGKRKKRGKIPARMYSRARVLPMSCERLQRVRMNEEKRRKTCM